MAELGPTARIVWTLARNHTWGQLIPEEDVIALATKDEDGDEMRAALDAALELSFLSAGPHGVYIPHGQTKHEEATDWLRENTGLREYKITATLSRLHLSGQVRNTLSLVSPTSLASNSSDTN